MRGSLLVAAVLVGAGCLRPVDIGGTGGGSGSGSGSGSTGRSSCPPCDPSRTPTSCVNGVATACLAVLSAPAQPGCLQITQCSLGCDVSGTSCASGDAGTCPAGAEILCNSAPVPCPCADGSTHLSGCGTTAVDCAAACCGIGRACPSQGEVCTPGALACCAGSCVGRDPPFHCEPALDGGSCSLAVAPVAIDFGQVSAGIKFVRSVMFFNAGTGQCTISNVALEAATDPSFSLGPPPGQGASNTDLLAPGQATVAAVEFTLDNANPPAIRTGTLDVQSNDPLQPFRKVQLQAELGPTLACGAGGANFQSGGLASFNQLAPRLNHAPDGSRVVIEVGANFGCADPVFPDGGSGGALSFSFDGRVVQGPGAYGVGEVFGVGATLLMGNGGVETVNGPAGGGTLTLTQWSDAGGCIAGSYDLDFTTVLGGVDRETGTFTSSTSSSFCFN